MTSPTTIRLAVNVLAVCGSAALAGTMLTIGLSFGAYWKSLSPAAFLDWFAAHSLLIGRTIPLLAVPAVLGLLGSLWLDRAAPRPRILWALALGCAAAIALVTVAFHLPANAAFVAKTIAPEAVPAKLDDWLRLHWLRIALGFATAILGMIALRAR